MRFKVDENLPTDVAVLLRQAGYEADTVNDEGIGGCGDATVAALIQREGRVLVTLDLGFSDLRAYPPQEYPGLIVLRPSRQDKASVVEICTRLLKKLRDQPMAGCLWIVEPNRIRVRGDSR